MRHMNRSFADHTFQFAWLTTLFASLMTFGAAWAAEDPARTPIVTTDLLRLRTVGDLTVDAEGRRAVVAVRSIGRERGEEDEPEKWAARSHLYLLELDDENADPRRLTHGRRNDQSPRLSPDGKQLLFVRPDENPDESSGQLWLMPLDGGEARKLTTQRHGARDPQWSRDGTRILFTAPVGIDDLDGAPGWPHERSTPDGREFDPAEKHDPHPDGTREEVRAWLEKNAADFDPNVITRLTFQDEQRLRREMRFTHIFTLDLREDETATPERITDGFFDHFDARFLPDGQRVVCAAKRTDEAHPDRVRESDLWLIDPREEDRMRRMLTLPGWRLGAPRPSHDGSVVAFLAQRQDEPAFRQNILGLVPVNGPEDDEPVWLTEEETFRASIRSVEWKPRRTDLLFTAPVRGGFPLFSISPGVLRPVALIQDHDDLPLGVHHFAVGGERTVYARTTPAAPVQVRVRDENGDRLLFDLNEWVSERELSLPQPGELERPDGTKIEYWFMEPTRRAEDETYPVVLQIHGGPSAMWGPGELSMWHEFQLLASWGYGVVYANPRGSGGYGYRFQRANFQNWGQGPAGDVLAALDEVIEKNAWADPDRLVMTGGSYGGYLTAWIVAHDHRFRAAVAQRGVYHLPTFFGEGNAWRLLGWAMGGSPFDPEIREIMERESPFNVADRIETPLLIKHGDEDLRTGVSQSEMLYRALKELEKPVEFVRYPGAGHDMSRGGDPKQRMDRLNRIIEFFERHIDNPRAAPVRPES